MHDPDFLAVEIHSPIPWYDRWQTRMYKKGTPPRPFIRRRTNEENLGERVYSWWNLKGYDLRIGKIALRFPTLIEAWHHEPGGGDMGTVCNYRDRDIWWIFKHWSHLHWRLMPYLRIKRWLFDRCEDCGKRFRWGEARFGTGWDSPGLLHDACHRVRHLRGQVADLAKYVRGEANQTEQWRVRYAWLDNSSFPPYWSDLGVGVSNEKKVESSDSSFARFT